MEYSLQTSLRDLVLILFRRRWSALTILLVGVLTSIVYIWFVRGTVYEVTGKVMVRLGREEAPPSTIIGQAPTVMSYRYQDVQTEVELLKSSDLIETLVDRLHMDVPKPPPPPPPGILPRVRYELKRISSSVKDWSDELLIHFGLKERLTFHEKTVFGLQKALLVTWEKESNVVSVHLLLSQREGGGFILGKLLEYFQEFRTRMYSESTAAAYFEQERNRNARALAEAGARINAFENKWDISSIDKQKAVLLDQIAQTNTQLADATLRLREAQQRSNLLAAMLNVPEPEFAQLGTFDHNDLPANMLLQLSELQRDRERLRMTDLDNSPPIQNNRAQFKVLLGILTSNTQASLREAQANFAAREAEDDRLRERLRTLTDKEIDWEGLKRGQKLAEDSYIFETKKLEEANASSRMNGEQISNVVVIERPTDPIAPAGIRKTTLFAISLVVVVFLIVTWLSVAEFFDHRIYSSESLARQLGAPVIGVIPVRAFPLRTLEGDANAAVV